MKTALFVLGLSFASLSGMAQSAKKVTFKSYEFESSAFKIYLVDVVSTAGITKFKVRIENLTDDYLMFEPGKTKVWTDQKEQAVTQRKVIDILPKGFGSYVISVTGLNGSTQDLKTFIDGISKISEANKKSVKGPILPLPSSEREIIIGNFKLTHYNNDTKVSNKLTYALFDVTYTGDQVGVVNPNRVHLKVNGDLEYPMANSGHKPYLMLKGDTEKFHVRWTIGKNVADMSKAKAEIDFKDAFSESKLERLKGVEHSFSVDVVDGK